MFEIEYLIEEIEHIYYAACAKCDPDICSYWDFGYVDGLEAAIKKLKEIRDNN